MPRWRTRTWAFIIWNVVMATLLWLLYSTTVGSSCDDLPPNTSMCGMAGLVDMLMFIGGLLAVVVVWPIGAIIIGMAWRNGRGGARGR